MADNDLTDQNYWDERWGGVPLPREIHPVKNPIDRRFSRLFRRLLPRGGRCLEIGCAASAWLPFFARDLGSEIWGVDYSPRGLALSAENHRLLGLEDHLIAGDFLTADLPASGFRIVYSSGVVEHYRDPGPIFRRACELLEPGGVKVTVIPNMAGVFGSIQKATDREVYDAHVPFRPGELDRHQLEAGLEPLCATRPFGVFALGVVNMDRVYRARSPRSRRILAYIVQYLDRLIGWSTMWAGRLLDSRHTSPYLVSIYRKPL